MNRNGYKLDVGILYKIQQDIINYRNKNPKFFYGRILPTQLLLPSKADSTHAERLLRARLCLKEVGLGWNLYKVIYD